MFENINCISYSVVEPTFKDGKCNGFYARQAHGELAKGHVIDKHVPTEVYPDYPTAQFDLMRKVLESRHAVRFGFKSYFNSGLHYDAIAFSVSDKLIGAIITIDAAETDTKSLPPRCRICNELGGASHAFLTSLFSSLQTQLRSEPPEHP